MMRILELSKPFNHGGMAEHVVTLSVKLHEKGHFVTVASQKGDHLDKLAERGIGHTPLSFTVKNPFGFLSCARKLKRIIRENNIEIVHCHYRACAFYMRYLQVFCGLKVPFLWSNHLFEIPSSGIRRRFTFPGKKIIAVSEELKENLIERFDFDPDDITVINNGVEIDALIPPTEEEKLRARKLYGAKAKTVCSLLARFTEVKGHEVALRALERLMDEDVVMLFSGEGDPAYKAKIDKIIEQKGLEDKVIFVGQTDARTLLSASDMMILPSYKEGCPISVFEAFAMKVPVVRTKTSGYSETKDYLIGTDIGDAEQFARGIKSLIDNPEKGKELAEQAYRAVCEKWTTDVLADNVLKIYEEVLNK